MIVFIIRQCLHIGNPTAKIEYFPSGTRRLKIDISRRQADCFLITYPVQSPFCSRVPLRMSSVPASRYRSVLGLELNFISGRVILKSVRSVCGVRSASRRCSPPARTSKWAGSPRSARTKTGGDRIKGHTGMCDPLLPALENEQNHSVVYAGLTHTFKISNFYSS